VNYIANIYWCVLFDANEMYHEDKFARELFLDDIKVYGERREREAMDDAVYPGMWKQILVWHLVILILRVIVIRSKVP